MGQKDHTGFKQAGVVHEDEWVAPKWMIKGNQHLFNELENVREKGSFAQGGFTSNTPISISNSQENRKSEQYLFVLADEMKKMNRLLRRVTDGGEAMVTKAIA